MTELGSPSSVVQYLNEPQELMWHILVLDSGSEYIGGILHTQSPFVMSQVDFIYAYTHLYSNLL